MVAIELIIVLFLPEQHESSTRTVDDNVWDEIRNFKKCLIMMFAKQEKDLVFLETVMGLSKQRRHCMIECIPVPQKVAKQAPLYFKKVGLFIGFFCLCIFKCFCGDNLSLLSFAII